MLCVVVIVALVGVAGWFYWRRTVDDERWRYMEHMGEDETSAHAEAFYMFTHDYNA